jgi:hypothetical protein
MTSSSNSSPFIIFLEVMQKTISGRISRLHTIVQRIRQCTTDKNCKILTLNKLICTSPRSSYRHGCTYVMTFVKCRYVKPNLMRMGSAFEYIRYLLFEDLFRRMKSNNVAFPMTR